MKNEMCRLYRGCLDTAVELNLESWECRGCHLQNDKTREGRFDNEPMLEILACCRLMIEIFEIKA